MIFLAQILYPGRYRESMLNAISLIAEFTECSFEIFSDCKLSVGGVSLSIVLQNFRITSTYTIAVLVDFCLKTPKVDFSYFSVFLWLNL